MSSVLCRSKRPTSSGFSVVRLTLELFDELTSTYHFSSTLGHREVIGGILDDRQYSYIILDQNDRPIGAFGLVMLWQGVGQVWLFTSPALEKFPLYLVRLLKKTLSSMEFMSRIQMTVKESEPRNKRFAEALGFTSEGLMIRYGVDGSNHYLMARYA